VTQINQVLSVEAVYERFETPLGFELRSRVPSARMFVPAHAVAVRVQYVLQRLLDAEVLDPSECESLRPTVPATCCGCER
jgi:hypothetical protein